MGRPPLGKSARTVVLTTKASEAERAALIARYGSVYTGLRMGIRLALGDKPTNSPEPSPVTPPGHRHRRGQELEPVYNQGTKVRRYQCAEEGCEEVLS